MPTSSNHHTLTTLLSSKVCRRILLALAMISIVFMGTYYFHIKQHQLLSSAEKQYGESISQLIAEQIAPQLINHDAISLQAVSQKTVDSTAIVSLIIYDINNHILAQADKNINNEYLEDIQHFTTPIISSNNIIGSVTISLTTALYQSQLGISSLLPKTLLLLLVIIILMVLVLLAILTKGTKKIDHKDEENIKSKQHASIKPDNQESSHTKFPTDLVTLTLSINNIEMLYQQLNAELRIQQLSNLNSQLQKALKLYGGKLISNTGEMLVIGFESTNKENILKAIYSGMLLLELNKNSDHSIILFGLMIQSTAHYAKDEDTNLPEYIDNAYRYKPDNTEILIEKSLYEEYDLKEKIEVSNQNQAIITITSLDKQCQSLINKQLEQLQ